MAQSCNPAILEEKDMEWLAESSLVTLLMSWIHTDVDFKSGLSYIAGNVMTAMTLPSQ